MNLIDKWKNRETKKKLREENIRLMQKLEDYLKVPSPVITVERNIQMIKSSVEVSRADFECGITTEYIKEDIARRMIGDIKPFIEFDFVDSPNYGGKIYIGTLYVATGDRKNECF